MRESASAEVAVKGFSTTTGDDLSELFVAIATWVLGAVVGFTVFATPHGLFCELRMVATCADNDKFNIRIREELICSAVVFHIRIVDSAVLSGFDVGFVGRRFSTLQDGVRF